MRRSNLSSVFSPSNAVYLFFLLLLLGCGGSSSSPPSDAHVSTNANANTDLTPESSIHLAVSSQQILSGADVVVSWNSQSVDECVASGGWSGARSTSGSELIENLNKDETFILSCDGVSGVIVESISVVVVQPPPPSGTASVTGKIDSSLLNMMGDNHLYLFEGVVAPDDIDGDSGDPLATAQVIQSDAFCEWSYVFNSLSAGEYTLALTKQAKLDDAQTDDVIEFERVITVSLSAGETEADFAVTGIIKVGPGRSYATPSAAAAVAGDGDVIEIDAAVYQDDVVVWRQNDLTLRGVGGRPHLQSTQIIPYLAGDDRKNGMGIWVTKGRNIHIENIEFSGARVPDENGAGIRANGRDLSICGSYFHDNENGILGSGGAIQIDYSEFDNNGLGEYGRTHNIYIVGGDRFILRHSYSHHANVGHNVKSRARENFILYNRIMDEGSGNSSYAVDIPNGGLTFVMGNLMQQGVNTDNSTMFPYGAEGLSGDGRTHRLYVVNNTFVNDRGAGTFVAIAGNTESAIVSNNVFAGGGTVVSGLAQMASNLIGSTPGFVDRAAYDYRLLGSSAAVDGASAMGVRDGIALTPLYHYSHKSQRETRVVIGDLDIGAYEFSP